MGKGLGMGCRVLETRIPDPLLFIWTFVLFIWTSDEPWFCPIEKEWNPFSSNSSAAHIGSTQFKVQNMCIHCFLSLLSFWISSSLHGIPNVSFEFMCLSLDSLSGTDCFLCDFPLGCCFLQQAQHKNYFHAVSGKLCHPACHKHFTFSSECWNLSWSPVNISSNLPWGHLSNGWATICFAAVDWGKFCPRCSVSCSIAFCKLVICASTCCWCWNNAAARCSADGRGPWGLKAISKIPLFGRE